MENEGFRIYISSDLDYEGMVIKIFFNDKELALLNCDKGIENTEIQFFDKYSRNFLWSFDYNTFIAVLSSARDQLEQANINGLDS